MIATVEIKRTVMLPSRSDGSEMAVPHAQEWKRDGRRPMRRKMQSTIPIVASTKIMPQKKKRKPKEASLYPSDRIWRLSESTGNARSIGRR